MTALGCGLADGDRFGRAGARPGVLRIHVLAPVTEIDPPRTRDGLERALALQAFATLAEPDGRPRLARAIAPSADGRHVIVTLDARARFSDGTGIDADAVVWSWRRALLRSTGAADLRPFSSIAHGKELAEGRLLRLARDTPGYAAPFATVGGAPSTSAPRALSAGSMVEIVDSNERRPCCGRSVPLLREAGRGEALGALNPTDVGTVIGARNLDGQRFLLLRSSSGAAGWAAQQLVSLHVPPASLLRVVDRGDGGAALRVGPDDDAPVRQALRDSGVVEVLGEADAWVHAVDLESGLMGFVPLRTLEALRGEQQWLHVVPADVAKDPESATWVPLRELAFDPSALGAIAVDAHSIEVECAADVTAVLAALAHPVMAPVPPHTIAAHGHAWTAPGTIVTSGPFTPVSLSAARSTLARSERALEHERARLERVELVVVDDPIAALHLYRAGELDVLLSLPADLAPGLERAADWVAGGGLVAAEVRGLSLAQLDLRDVVVAPP
ncbi:MAG: hypothetical protein IT383_13645 [Deltaproteobacteria bacterium]|nr:hypothetical protein [Deltaproteobacteria bacterium]